MICRSRMKVTPRACFALAAIALSAQAAFSQGSPQALPARPDDLQQRWSVGIAPTLHQDVRSAGQAQTFGSTMMVPLHAAFRLGNKQWEQDFADHFSRTAANFTVLPAEDLGRMEYLYVASQFMVLAKDSGHMELIPRTLPGLVYSDILTLWTKKPAWQWGRQPFPGGARERILWKLNTHRVDKKYYRVMIDQDLFMLAIAADLKNYTTGHALETKTWGANLDDMVSIAHQIFSQETVAQPGGGWLFQPGVWSDHPEYQYAGNPEIRPGMKPAPVENVAVDSSHSFRFPLWLTSFMHAYPPDSEGSRFFEGLRSGLEKQFFNKVLVRPGGVPCYRLNNFMDGRNGVYRWNYESLGQGHGYGPYELSGSLMLGWWAFLDTDRARDLYRDLAATFPWPKECIQLYLGPRPDAGYPASAFEPGSSSMRAWDLLVKLASQM